MLKIFGLAATFIIYGCGVSQTSMVSPIEATNTSIENTNRDDKATGTCDIGLREKITAFHRPVPGDFRDLVKDTRFLNELKECPRDEIVKSIVALRASHAEDYEIKVKTTYLLIKLGHDVRQNKKKLLSVYSSYPYENIENNGISPDRVIDMISDIIQQDDQDREFLAEALELRVNGASATGLFGVVTSEFEKSPNDFLRTLKSKPKKIRQGIYEGMCFSTTKDKLVQGLASVRENSDTYPVSKEMLKFIGQSDVCKSGWKEYGIQE